MSISLKKALTLTGLIVFALLGLFCPWVVYQVGDVSITEIGFTALFGHGWNGLSLLIFGAYLTLIVSIIFVVNFNDNKVVNFVLFMLTFTIGILFSFFPFFFTHISGIEDLEAGIHAGPIMLAIQSFLITVYTMFSNPELKEMNKMSVYEMVEMSIFIALAVVLDMFAKIDINSGAGSIGFSMFPLMIIALRHGPIKGFVACGIVFGLITCATDGYGFMYYPFDYLLGYGSVALMGLFKNLILPKGEYPIKGSKGAQFGYGIAFLIVGAVAVFVGRTLASTISSMVYYGYTFVEGLAYQMTYVPGSCGVSIAIVILLYKPLLIINEKFPTTRELD